MLHYYRFTLVSLACFLLLGCQVAQQALDATTSLVSPTSLESIEIRPWERTPVGSLPQVTQHAGEVLAITEVSSSPPQLVSAASDGSVIVWDLPSGSGQLLKKLPSNPQIAAIGATLPLVAYVDGGRVRVSCLAQCKADWSLERLKARAVALSFHDKDTSVLIAGADGRVYRWHYELERTARDDKQRDLAFERYVAHQTLISGVASHPSDRAFFSTDWDGTLIGWLPYSADDQGGAYDTNLSPGRFFGHVGTSLRALRKPDRGIASLAVSADGRRLVLGIEDGYVEVWEVRGFTLAARHQLHSGRVSSVAISRDGARIASVGRDSLLTVNELSPDSSYGVSATASPFTMQELDSETVSGGVSNLLFVSSGNVVFSTKSGQVGELSLKGFTPKPRQVELPLPAPQSPRRVDSDY